jgi:hypothetical protein
MMIGTTMASDDFLDGLVGDLKPVRRRDARFEALAFAGLCAIELALWLISGHVRPGLMYVAETTPTFWWKTASAAALATLGAATAIGSLDPTRSPRRGLVTLVVLVATFFFVGALLALNAGLANLGGRLDWTDGLTCVAKVALLSAPPAVVFGLLLRRGAPTEIRGTALAAGVGGAAWAVFVYFFACPHDDPVYILVWYPIACAASTLAARLALPLVGRW